MRSTWHIVIKIVNENTFQVDPKWNYFYSDGKYVQIFGLLPVDKEFRDHECARLENLIIGKRIEIRNACYLSGGALIAIVYLDDKPVISYFQENQEDEAPVRVLTEKSFNRWQFPSDFKSIVEFTGLFPEPWDNPINKIPLDKDPFFRSLIYPTKKWESTYQIQKQIADKFFSPKQYDSGVLDRNLKKLLSDPERDGDLLLIGEIGIGKTWFISHFLMNLEEDKYDSILIDMRHVVLVDDLIQSLDDEIELFFDSYLLPDLIWCQPFFKKLYGDTFNPNLPIQRQEIVKYSLSLTTQQRNKRRLQYYSSQDSKKLIICFDNIDQLSGYDQEKMVDFCRRLTGGKTNVKVIYTLRPDNSIIKSRFTQAWGDSSIKSFKFQGTDIFDILERRLTHDRSGESWTLETKIPNSDWTYGKILEIYKGSDNAWGTAGFIRGISSTAKIKQGIVEWGPEEKRKVIWNRIDVRHYLQLFRRVLRSEYLRDFSNIGNLYYGIQALMIKFSGYMNEEESYLFNLFDNENSTAPGNALIRYRVLEYFQLFKLADSTFDVFFKALGYDVSQARFVLQKFIEADLVDIYPLQGSDQLIGELTIPGKRHFEIVQNLWYIICIKTGMNIYNEHILYGDEAKKEARKYNLSEPLLDHYAENGWVSERGFIDFIADQVALEAFRFNEFLENPENKGDAKIVENMYRSVPLLHFNLFDSINKQLNKWGK